MGVRRAARQGSDRRFSTDTIILPKKRRGREDEASPWHVGNLISTMFLENINRQEGQLAGEMDLVGESDLHYQFNLDNAFC